MYLCSCWRSLRQLIVSRDCLVYLIVFQMHVAFVIKINLVMFLKNSIRETWNSSFNVFFLVGNGVKQSGFLSFYFFYTNYYEGTCSYISKV